MCLRNCKDIFELYEMGLEWIFIFFNNCYVRIWGLRLVHGLVLWQSGGLFSGVNQVYSSYYF